MKRKNLTQTEQAFVSDQNRAAMRDFLVAGEDLEENAVRAFLYGKQEARLTRIEEKLDTILELLNGS